MPTELPHSDELFARYFLNGYSDYDRERYPFGEGARPDVQTLGYAETPSASDLSPLNEEGQEAMLGRVKSQTETAFFEFRELLDLRGVPDLAWIESVDEHFDEASVAELIAASDPHDASNIYKATCISFGLLVAQVLQSMKPDLQWIADSPYWESALYHLPSQNLIAPVHWGIKKMSGYGCNDGFAAKCIACAGMLDR